jgi:hypothetical protein
MRCAGGRDGDKVGFGPRRGGSRLVARIGALLGRMREQLGDPPLHQGPMSFDPAIPRRDDYGRAGLLGAAEVVGATVVPGPFWVISD